MEGRKSRKNWRRILSMRRENGGRVKCQNNHWIRVFFLDSHKISCDFASLSHPFPSTFWCLDVHLGLCVSSFPVFFSPWSQKISAWAQRGLNWPIKPQSERALANQEVTRPGSEVREDNGCGVGGNFLPQGTGACVVYVCVYVCLYVIWPQHLLLWPGKKSTITHWTEA